MKQNIVNKINNSSDFNDPKKYGNWLTKMLKNKQIIKIRNDLYTLVDKDNKPLSDRFQIASNINTNSFLCYHSALEYYGLAHQIFNEVHVGSTIKFNKFSFNDICYKWIKYSNSLFVKYDKTNDIKVTTLEKTIIDCIDNINAIGGLEELLYCLEYVQKLDEQKCLLILNKINKLYLYQKAGYLFEKFNTKFSFSKKFFESIKKHLSNKINYLAKDEYKSFSYNKTWRLMVPELKELNGGYSEEIAALNI